MVSFTVLPVFPDCPFLIPPSIFFNVYLIMKYIKLGPKQLENEGRGALYRSCPIFFISEDFHL